MEFGRGLQSSKRGHASYRKISSPDWDYRKLYYARIIGGDLNLPFADCNGNASGNSGTHALINCVVLENG